MRRRAVLGAGALSVGAVAAASPASAAPVPPVPVPRTPIPAVPVAAVGRAAPLRSVPVQGTDLTVMLRPGAIATILVHAIRRFHYEIETLRAGDLVPDRSGTAVGIRPGAYPDGASGAFLPHQLIVIRDIVATAEGLLRWGGDRPVPAEGRFEIAVDPADPRLAPLATRLLAGRGPGADMALPFTPARRKIADTVHRRMR
jgi:hypothetical protein